MKTSIATVSISGEFPEKLAAIAKAGFTGVEIFENDFLTYDASPRQVAALVRDHGLEVTLFQPFRDFGDGRAQGLRHRLEVVVTENRNELRAHECNRAR